jgi:hypothetical protein
LRDHAKRQDYTITILRPQMIVGPNHGIVMNLPPVVGFDAVLRHLQEYSANRCLGAAPLTLFKGSLSSGLL